MRLKTPSGEQWRGARVSGDGCVTRRPRDVGQELPRRGGGVSGRGEK
jgi:hypothetical protein